MRDEYVRYIENYSRVDAIKNETYPENISDEELVRRVHENVEEIYAIHKDNTKILQGIFSRPAEEMTLEEEEDLFQFASRLHAFIGHIDLCGAYHIHRYLRDWALYHNDEERIIRQDYFCGLSSYYVEQLTRSLYLPGMEQAMDEYFAHGAAYIDKYDELKDSETRGYLIRCMANERLGFHFVKLKGQSETRNHIGTDDIERYYEFFQRIMPVMNNAHYRELAPDLPWDTFIYSIHLGRTSLMSVLRNEYLEHRDTPEYHRLAEYVYESARYVYFRQEAAGKEQNRMLRGKTQYAYYSAQFHVGEITLDQLLEHLFSVVEHANRKDYTTDGIFENLQLINYIENYCRYLPTSEAQEGYKDRIAQLRHRADSYIRKMDKLEFRNAMFTYVRDQLTVMAYRKDDGDEIMRRQAREVLHMILVFHKPTYVHSIMVGRLAKELTVEMCRKRPELLVGILGTKSVEEVQAREQEIGEHMYEAGLYHDIGKGEILDVINLYERNLFDEEFKIIKTHPYAGYRDTKEFTVLRPYSQVILRHHKFYDDSRGYPEYAHRLGTVEDIMVDIVCVADSIDAATDNVGRSYAVGKSFETLIGELRHGSGTRYSPDVVSLFDDPQFENYIKEGLEKQRREAYIQVYRSQNTTENQ